VVIMQSMDKTRVIAQGTRYALGLHDGEYVIWDMSQVGRPIIMHWRMDEAGEREANAAFSDLEGSLPVAQPYMQPTYGGQPSKNSMATAGGALGIIGMIFSLTPVVGILVGFVMGVLAVIFSGIGLGRADQIGGRGIATTGLVLGILTIIFKLIPGVNLL